LALVAVVLACGLVFSRTATGQASGASNAAYDLRGGKLAKGSTVHVTVNQKFTDAKLTVSMGGMDETGTISMNVEGESTTTILDVDANGAATKKSMRIGKNPITTNVSVGGNDNEEIKESPLANQTVVGTLTKKGWRYQLENGTPDDAQKKLLAKMNNDADSNGWLPKDAVTVGHAWTVTNGDLSGVLDLTRDADALNGSFKFRFVRIEKHNGEDCAVIEGQGKVSGSSEVELDDDNDFAVQSQKAEFSAQGKVVFVRSLRTGLVVSTSFEGQVRMSMPIEAGGEMIQMTMEGPYQSRETNTAKNAK
jgi:hypothetical protein